MPVKPNKEYLILVGEKNNKDAIWFRITIDALFMV